MIEDRLAQSVLFNNAILLKVSSCSSILTRRRLNPADLRESGRSSIRHPKHHWIRVKQKILRTRDDRHNPAGLQRASAPAVGSKNGFVTGI